MESLKFCSSDVNVLDIYFEFTSDDFHVAPNQIREEGQHLCDLWETKRMFRISGFMQDVIWHTIYTKPHIIKGHMT